MTPSSEARALRRRRFGSIGVSVAMVLTITGQVLSPTGRWSVLVVVASVLLLLWCAVDGVRAHRALRHSTG